MRNKETWLVDAALDRINVTQNMRSYLGGTSTRRTYPRPAGLLAKDGDEVELTSVYMLAAEEGVTLQDWVYKDPELALASAEQIVAMWEKVLTQATLTQTVNGVKFTREGVKLLERSVMNARDDVGEIKRICAGGNPDQLRRDRLIEALYNKALNGDLRAAQYFIDRVDGKIGDEPSDKTDYSSMDNVYKIVHGLFMKQLEVLNSGPGTKILCCSRKSGKTHYLAAHALIEALKTPNTVILIIGKTMQLQENLINIELQQLIDRHALSDSKGNRLNWRHLENGSKIMIRGLSNTKDPDTIRGINAKVIIMDEFFHMDSELLAYMQTEVLEPMQLAYANDYTFIMCGTPPAVRGTYGEKVWEESTIPHFSWTYRDNPYIVDGDAFVAQKLAEKGLDRMSPYAQREYDAKWVYDSDALLYPVYHTWDEDKIPAFEVDSVLIGVDYGVSDNDAIIATAWDTTNRRGFVFYEERFNRLTCPRDVTQLEYLKKCCREVWEYALDFWPSLSKREANQRITWDADSSDGHLTEELEVNLKCRYDGLHMNIGTAHKHDKILMQDKIRDLLRTAMLLLPKGGKTETECKLTVLKRDKQGRLTLDIDDKMYHPELLHALRYSLWTKIGLEVIKARTGQESGAQLSVVDHLDEANIHLDEEYDDGTGYTDDL